MINKKIQKIHSLNTTEIKFPDLINPTLYGTLTPQSQVSISYLLHWFSGFKGDFCHSFLNICLICESLKDGFSTRS